MPSSTESSTADTCVRVDPGICGFPCRIIARKKEKRVVSIQIDECACDKIQKMAQRLIELSLRDLFLPLSRNPVYQAVEKSGCHLSCPIPMAIIKAAEVALELALPKDAHIQFSCETIESDSHETA